MTKTTWNATNKTKHKEKSHKYCNATIVEQNILDSAYGMQVNLKSTKFGICQNHQHSIYHFPSINGEVKSKYKKLGSAPPIYRISPSLFWKLHKAAVEDMQRENSGNSSFTLFISNKPKWNWWDRGPGVHLNNKC